MKTTNNKLNNSNLSKGGDSKKHVLLIAGSRGFNDYNLLCSSLKPENIKCIISGCARGADTLAIRYANEHGIPCIKMPADWSKYGNAAGAIRNIAMVDKATAIICFWDGISRGTKITIDYANKVHKPLKVVPYKKGGDR